MVDDMISRRATIDKINERQRKLIYCFGFDNDMVKIMDIAKSIITAIPSAQPEYEPVTAENFAKTMSENSFYNFVAWHQEALTLMKEQGFVICKKNDVIYRQAAIETIMSDKIDDNTLNIMIALGSGEQAKTFNSACDRHALLLNDLPSAQPEQIWIPCSKRMPEEHEWIGTKKFGTTISDEVYVTLESPKGERFTKHLNFQNGKVSSIDVFYEGSVPIAWMPLPEPYRGGDE